MDLSEIEDAVFSGKSIEEIAGGMTWQYFEELCSSIFEKNGFSVKKRFRFNDGGSGHEIDILAETPVVKKHGRGIRKTTKIMAVDCKHWSVGRTSALKKAADMQEERAKALKKVDGYKRKPALSVLVTLFQENVILEGNTWIVPIFKLNSFLNSDEAF
ncbi:MAG: restriction endonuclease [Candidatus Aenigmatarchaeota archaeon]